MDEHIISRITVHLSARDLAMFAQVNKSTYQYCKHTNVNRQLCKHVVHHPYHYIPTLLEQAKLEHCMKFLQDVNTLSLNRIPMQKFRIAIGLWKPCGAKINILIGRCVIINQIMYTYSYMDFLAESQNNVILKDGSIALLIDTNMERLIHKVNSIISHKYDHIEIKTYDFLKGGFKKDLVDGLKYIHRFLRCCSSSY